MYWLDICELKNAIEDFSRTRLFNFDSIAQQLIAMTLILGDIIAFTQNVLLNYKEQYLMQSAASKKYPKLSYSEDGFTESFDVETMDPVKVGEFYKKYGLVIFRNVLNQEDIDLTISSLWGNVEKFTQGKIHRNKPETWDFAGTGFLRRYGFVNYTPLYETQFWKNRQNPKIYQSFKRLYEITSGKQSLGEPLIASFDRGSIIRPAKDHPQWKTQDIYHFDINPWWFTKVCEDNKWANSNSYEHIQDFTQWLGQGNYSPYAGYTKLAGVLALSDTNEMSGGFECVCGFHNQIHQWCVDHEPDTGITEDPELMSNFSRIFMRKGSLLIFSRELPHNIYPNQSHNFRYAQYVRMSPLSALQMTEQQTANRKQFLRQMIPSDLNVDNAISRQIFMLDQSNSQFARFKKCQVI